MPFDSPLYRAVKFAASIHDGQTKRGSDEPFIAHVCCVAMRLQEEGADEDVVIAGLLHDSVEKTDATPESLAAQFGERVARIVETCTERDDLNSWTEKKAGLLRAMQSAGPDVKMVMMADKVYNISALLDAYRRHGGAVWERYEEGRETRLWYFREIREVAEEEVRKGTVCTLYAEYVRIHDALLSALQSGG